MTREEAKEYLINISYKLGNMSIEYLTEKDGEKMREAINTLEQEPFINKPCVSEKVCEYDKNVVLEKIKAEIEQTAKDYDKFDDYRRVRGLWIALDIIDKYTGSRRDCDMDKCFICGKEIQRDSIPRIEPKINSIKLDNDTKKYPVCDTCGNSLSIVFNKMHE